MSTHRKKATEDSGPIVPAWFLTYSDTVTLLMTFFVMLMSFSTLDDEDYERVSGSLMAHLGVASQRQMSRDSLLLRRMMASSRLFVEGYENPPDHDPISQVKEDFQIRACSTSLANILNYRITEQGFEIHILAGSVFEEGMAELKPTASRVLDLVGKACRNLPHPLRVQAYSEPFFVPSQWAATPEELALERAAAASRYLNERHDIALDRLFTASAVGSGVTSDASSGKQLTLVVLRPTRRETSK